ncbi:hypothetical protein B0H14DRAFT_3144170 [Mycena olivaceomarginata]|nr:hypothetical protein B0H14DRAFT_3144170 [Mycena olivaceomarginata]
MAPSTLSPTAKAELDRIAKLYEVSDDHLAQIVQAFGDAFNKGLQAPYQPITMGPSWVIRAPDGTETGTALTLDLGWNSVHVAMITLDGKRSYTKVAKTFDIPKEMMRAQATTFFDFVVGRLCEFLDQNGIKDTSGLLLGFSFAFATEKANLSHGKLLSWSKGFSVQGAVGQDVVALLQAALDRAHVNIKCNAMINDVAVIYGAGTNAAYFEKGQAITKLSQFQGSSMLINTEWGGLNDRSLLKPTVYDEEMIKRLANPDNALFQKMICWFYLGEIARQVFLSLVNQSLLFNGVATEALKRHSALSTFHFFQIEDSSGPDAVKTLLCDLFEYTATSVSDQDVEIATSVATLIAVRGAKLAACPIAALLTRLGYTSAGAGKVPVAVDGELFIGSTRFEGRLKEGVASILGRGFDKELEFYPVKGQGFVGAAIAAVQAAQAK